MNIKTELKRLIFSLFMLSMSLSAIGQKDTNERAEWFVDSRFGMFIHWGMYSAAEGIWKGEKLRLDNDYAEWIYYRNRIAKDEYLTLLNRFDWDGIDPEEWVLLAKNDSAITAIKLKNWTVVGDNVEWLDNTMDKNQDIRSGSRAIKIEREQSDALHEYKNQ